ncbi:pyrroline-5-carboxylate reductase [Cohnella rhizosphaerae]|uniref:Pyrroline-5-carboxylate reductase n=1 Tax=Cohnella rhizosphaerae TaxID=1457232 RepID=A0A9X4QV95_9BACL|nr:pyrroline-5-carboxylate reductase [Cohnella rhizosphaerae]MDG0813056.1 pyrroline-5-carboxylate reductase [Cohnella rhizosphaerae]
MHETTGTLAHSKICFYGAGSMAEAIVRGLVDTGAAPAGNITVFNRSNAGRLAELRARYGVLAADSEAARQDALLTADVIVLAMKPKDAASALEALAPALRAEQLLVSVIAGLSIDTIRGLTSEKQPVVRTMPNTSSSIGLGATGISFSEGLGDDAQRLALDMFGAVGIAQVVEERLLEAVTAVSGSGPAYIYFVMEAMIASGVAQGLTPEAARELTVQTVRGAADMVRLTGEQPSELRRKVTSPNGTTQAAIETLQRHGVDEAFEAAMRRCAERAGELGRAIAEEALQG